MTTQLNWVRIRNEIVSLLKEVPGISIVHPFPRLEKDRQRTRWVSVFQDDKRVNAWTVLRVNNAASFNVCKQVEVVTNILLVGMLEHNDEMNTFDEFDEIIDQIQEKFFIQYRLEGSVILQGPASLQLEELRQVSNTTVHYAEISIQAISNIHY